jgi:hypothetical protein
VGVFLPLFSSMISRAQWTTWTETKARNEGGRRRENRTNQCYEVEDSLSRQNLWFGHTPARWFSQQKLNKQWASSTKRMKIGTSFLLFFLFRLPVERQHERSYNENYTPSRPLWEVKSHLAWSVVRWVTTCEARVLFVFCHALMPELTSHECCTERLLFFSEFFCFSFLSSPLIQSHGFVRRATHQLQTVGRRMSSRGHLETSQFFTECQHLSTVSIDCKLGMTSPFLSFFRLQSWIFLSK